MQYKYFVYNDEGLYKSFRTLRGYWSSLYNFIKTEGPWVFGNNLEDKRWSYTDTDPVMGKWFVRDKLEKVKYVVYELVDDEEVLYPVNRIEQLMIEHRWHGTYRPYKDEFFKRRKCFGEHYRNGLPVPGVHKYSNGSYHRKVRFAQELRATYGNEEYIRPKRRRRNLPNSRDDFPILLIELSILGRNKRRSGNGCNNNKKKWIAG